MPSPRGANIPTDHKKIPEEIQDHVSSYFPKGQSHYFRHNPHKMYVSATISKIQQHQEV